MPIGAIERIKIYCANTMHTCVNLYLTKTNKRWSSFIVNCQVSHTIQCVCTQPHLTNQHSKEAFGSHNQCTAASGKIS